MKAEQFINDYTKGCSNELCAVEDKYGKKVISYHEWLTPDQALRAAEIAKEETIEKVCKWLKSNICYDENGDGNMEWVVMFMDDDEMVENFKKFMED